VIAMIIVLVLGHDASLERTPEAEGNAARTHP
jgi:hypothetical protein